jgi:glycosyltransferase involved in cell wall biosynthesis
MPTVSVIIPTHNRSASLRRSLDALAHQDYPLDQMEVIVVADGCSDDTVEMLTAYQAPFTLHFIEQSGKGAAIARNSGAAKATAPLLIFLDDDIEASPQLVKAHIEVHSQPNQVVIGHLITTLKNQDSFFSILLRNWWYDKFAAMQHFDHRYTYQDLLSGNFSISATSFNAIGGFDSTLRCREDYELGLRLLKADVDFTFATAALGYHRDEVTDLDRSLKRKYQEGYADIQLSQQHPELTHTLPFSYTETFYSWLDQILLTFIFYFPLISDVLVNILRYGLGILEFMRMHNYWCRLHTKLLGYWYMRGVVDAMKSRQSLIDFLQSISFQLKAVTEEESEELELDLKEGLEVTERRLDEQRPVSVRLVYGRQIIGRIPPQAGAERLRGRHLRSALASTFSYAFLTSLILERDTDLVSSSKELPLKFSSHDMEVVHAS